MAKSSGWGVLGRLATGLCLLLGSSLALAQTSAPPIARVIVKLRASVVATWQAQVSSVEPSSVSASRARVGQLGTRLGLPMAYQRTIGRGVHVATARGLRSEQLAARLAAQPDVEYAVVDQRRHASATVPNDEFFVGGQASPYPPDGQWYLQSPSTQAAASGDFFVAGVNAGVAWDLSKGLRLDSTPVVVAVLDTGVRDDHVDLIDKLLPGYNMISDPARAGNSTGRSNDAKDLGDALSPTDITNNDADFHGCEVQLTSGWHGTQVAGLIGAKTNNAVGIAGLGWHVAILPVRVLGKCGGYDSDIIAGMRWAVGLSVDGVAANPDQNWAKVLNLSLGDLGACSAAYQDVITQIHARGAVIVAAAGNSDGQAVESPGNCPGVIAVAGLRHVGTKVGYSSLGREVAISAPGGNCGVDDNTCLYPIMSTSNTGQIVPDVGGSKYTDGTNAGRSIGTSFSAPLVSATAALMLAQRPTLSPAAVRQLLVSTARAFPTSGGSFGKGQCRAPSSSVQAECYCTTSTCGAGMLDAGLAVEAATTKAVAVITVASATASIGQTVAFSGAGSVLSPVGANLTYAWTLVDGGGVVTALSGDVASDHVTATPSGPGTFKVQLKVVDDTGEPNSNVAVQTIEVPAPAVAKSGGGGALDFDTLLWGLLMVAVGVRSRRAQAGRGI